MSAGPSRDRDKYRKYQSGAQKKKNALKRKENELVQQGGLLKFLKPTNVKTDQIENTVNNFEIPENTIDDSHTTSSSNKEIYDENNFSSNEKCLSKLDADPGKWPLKLFDNMRIYLINNIPVQVNNIEFPTDQNGRKFNKSFYNRLLPNGEIVCRNWLLYSKHKDKVFCYYCFMFPNQSSRSALSNEGICDWKHLGTRLKDHETSIFHGKAQMQVLELQKRLKYEKTIDQVQQRQINAEKEHWRGVLKRIIACIQFLAEHNDAFRGSSSKVFTKHNGKFLGLIEMISKFDVLMAEHLRRISANDISDHYLGWRIQNELITLMSKHIKDEIISRIKKSKYFSVQLDCTPDRSHQEQLTFIIRIVEIFDNANVQIKEYFICFVNITSTTGLHLTEELKSQLTSLEINLSDCRGQAYDNGANMIGRHQGVQARILSENPRAFFVPCSAHSLNLILGDMASSVPMAMTFFGIIQRFYTIFAASTERWNILISHVSELTLKPLSETRWECRLQSVKPIRFQLGQIHDALQEVSNTTKDPKIKSEAKSLGDNEFSYEFILSTVVWYELLSAIDKVSKSLQSMNIDLSIATSLLKGLKEFLCNFRENGFKSSQEIAQKLCDEYGISSSFKQNRLIKRKRFMHSEIEDSETNDPEEKFYRNYFLRIINQGIISIEERFKQLSHHFEHFGFLYNAQTLKLMSNEDLEKHCMDLDLLLRDGDSRDINGIDLYNEIKIFCNIIDSSYNTPLQCLQLLTKIRDSFPNLTVTLRILLTMPVTTATAERSFSKLKIIKNYMRTTMTQERLSNLALLSIESDLCEQLDYSDLINSFSEIKARKINFV